MCEMVAAGEKEGEYYAAMRKDGDLAKDRWALCAHSLGIHICSSPWVKTPPLYLLWEGKSGIEKQYQ